jgi:hypothetical protein
MIHDHFSQQHRSSDCPVIDLDRLTRVVKSRDTIQIFITDFSRINDDITIRRECFAEETVNLLGGWPTPWSRWTLKTDDLSIFWVT